MRICEPLQICNLQKLEEVVHGLLLGGGGRRGEVENFFKDGGRLCTTWEREKNSY